MNSKTAKLLKRYSTVIGAKHRNVKREWMRTPRPQRSTLRKAMEEQVE